ncbi:hypothetical protein [Tepidibacillus sp. LV47]|uniref:hypothetical protein n=1 Tax=Tepidibacillus sp. LV47 TaxID=3398228 RepID=UPI003AAE2BEE
MKKRYFKYFFSILAILIAFIMVQKTGLSKLETSSKTLLMANWLNELKKDPFFSDLNENTIQNSTEQYSLTPTHTMLTIPVNIGYKAYLIITTDSSHQEQIVEYGIGNFLPYQKNIITNQEIRQLTPRSFYYLSPIENFWKFDLGKEIVYIEGSTGEWLPDLNEQNIRSIQSTFLTYQDHLTEAYDNKNLSFYPSSDLSWLTISLQNKGIFDLNQIQTLLKNNQKMMFIGNKYNKQVKFAYPIIGYHLWNQNQLYLAIYDDDLDLLRFISLEDLLKFGQIVAWTNR